MIHKVAKKAFDELKLDKLPAIKKLNSEYSEVLSRKKSDYAEYAALRKNVREMLLHKQNYEFILGIENDKNNRNEHDRSMQKQHRKGFTAKPLVLWYSSKMKSLFLGFGVIEPYGETNHQQAKYEIPLRRDFLLC